MYSPGGPLKETFVITLLLCVLQLSCRGQNYDWIYTPPATPSGGRRLNGHMTHVHRGLYLVTQCAYVCLETDRCQSYNFNPTQGLCELNNVSQAEGIVLTTEKDFSYYPRNTYVINQVRIFFQT